MKDIIFLNNNVTFQTMICGIISSLIDYIDVVDEYTYHLGTTYGVFLIHIEDYTINGIKFTNSQDAVLYLNN